MNHFVEVTMNTLTALQKRTQESGSGYQLVERLCNHNFHFHSTEHGNFKVFTVSDDSRVEWIVEGYPYEDAMALVLLHLEMLVTE
ncbi:hypothetical protein [Vibrio harveyi]|uniref:hypothetical protein n=1 Tax=Vibrio harveyi TaxID=669 RepID=UPI0018F1BC44|nr:hypothetical protein [Vibrio harveyi]